jgi:GxxExxY protein
MVEQRDPLTWKIIGACIAVHRELGPGLLESVYEACLAFELGQRQIAFERKRRIPLVYRGHILPAYYEMDLVVEAQVVIELKAVEHVLPVHAAQVISYLKLSGLRTGLLINFHEAALKKGVYRYVNGAFDGMGTLGLRPESE